MLEKIAAQLGLNATFYYEFIIFALCYLVLSQTALKPFQRLLANRRARTVGLLDEAVKQQRLAEQQLSEYEARLKQVREGLRADFRAAEDLIKKEASKITEAAHSSARDENMRAQAELEAQRGKLVQGVVDQSKALASEIVSKVLQGA